MNTANPQLEGLYLAFPIRVLLLANEAHEQGTSFCFEDLAREIGRRT